MYNYILITLSAVYLTSIRQAYSDCGYQSHCVTVQACPSLLPLLRIRTRESLYALQEANCGYDRRNPLVCCEVQGPSFSPFQTKQSVNRQSAPIKKPARRQQKQLISPKKQSSRLPLFSSKFIKIKPAFTPRPREPPRITPSSPRKPKGRPRPPITSRRPFQNVPLFTPRPSTRSPRPPITTPRPFQDFPRFTPRPSTRSPRPPITTPRPFQDFPRFTPRPSTNPPSTSPRPTIPLRSPSPTFNTDLSKQCGIPKTITGLARVFGGFDAGLGSNPWMALLQYSNGRDVLFACAGSLITNRYVLTTAHCIALPQLQDRLISVRLGEHRLDSSPDCESNTCATPHIDVGIETTVIHPSYNTRVRIGDDIALIRLAREVTFSDWIVPICLPTANLDVGSFLGSRQATVSGWGITEPGEEGLNDVLQTIDLPFVDLDTCRPLNTENGALIPLVPEQLCFGGEAGRDTCTGDSGGPISAAASDGQVILLGLVSYGPNGACGVPNRPAVYTNVVSYVPWITRNMEP